MTATPYRNISIFAHDHAPDDPAGQREWWAEHQLSEWADTGVFSFFAAARDLRPDVSDAQFTELVDALFAAAADVTSACVIGNPRHLDQAQDEYAACLYELATRGDDLAGAQRGER